MAGNSYDILFSIIAVQEVTFFAPIAKRLMEEEGLKVAFLTFHEAGDDILDEEGIPYLSLHKIKKSLKKTKINLKEPQEIEKILGINIEKFILHEMLTANRKKDFLISKVATYCSIIDNIFKNNTIGCVVQELGGFIAPQMLYYVSRYNNVDHVFIEPAMFKKRVVFTLNNLYADITDYGKKDLPIDSELQQLLEDYMTQKTVVIPKKDRHFFQDMNLRRLLSHDNFRRLSRKLYNKYILGSKEEYNAILWYIISHFIKLLRRKVLNFYYSSTVGGEKYVYYPFHVPLDVQLTVRCPEFLNQEAVVGQIARSLPPGYKLYIKEHPAAIGGHSLSRLRELIKYNKNIRLIHPGHNSYDIIKDSDCVITINSKVGVEALIQGKPVVVLGRTFYRGKGVTVDVKNIEEVSIAIAKAVEQKTNKDETAYFLTRAFQWSYKGELYENSPENIDNFYTSLKRFMSGSGIIANDKHVLQSTVK